MWPDYSDVPASRERVGAMGWAGDRYPARITKPYVYRGTGEDTITPDPPKPEPKPKLTPEEKQAIRVNREAKRELDRMARKRKVERARRKRDAERDEARCQRTLERERERARRLAQPKPPPRSRYFRTEAPLDQPKPAGRVSRNLKPSPGWKPLTGADIDAILEEL